MCGAGGRILKWWHKELGLARQSPPSWYRKRLQEELQERRNAKTWLRKLSETSDVFFSISRAHYDGYPVRRLPSFGVVRHLPIYAYMLVKYTSRWRFYRTVAVLCNAPRNDLVREVVNPDRDQKLEEVALRYQLDPIKFREVGCHVRRAWPLFP